MNRFTFQSIANPDHRYVIWERDVPNLGYSAFNCTVSDKAEGLDARLPR